MPENPKQWQSIDAQIEIIRSRGMGIDDEAKAAHFLRRVGYYRLSGYWYPFRQMNPDGTPGKKRLDQFIEGSRFDDVIALYLFDRRLRLLALDAIERIELSVQVDVAHLLGRRDPFAHHDPRFLDKDFVKMSGSYGYQAWLEKYHALIKRSNAEFVRHNLGKYGRLPIWVAIEAWDFGTLSFFYKGMKGKDKTHIATKYGCNRSLTSWLRSLNFIRNVSAHHSRLWNCNIVDSASPKGLDEPLRNLRVERPFLYFCIMKIFLDVICPDASWGTRFKALIDEFPTTENTAVSLENMGVVEGWQSWDLWK